MIEELNLAVPMIGLAARKHLAAGEVAQGVGIEAGLALGVHGSDCSDGWMSIRSGNVSFGSSPAVVHLAALPVIETDDHGGIGDDDGIAAALGRNFEPALDR